MNKQQVSKIAEWSQPIFATTAGLLIAANIGEMWIIIGIWLFLCKDIMMFVFATINKYKGLLYSSIGAGALNVFGIIRWTFY